MDSMRSLGSSTNLADITSTLIQKLNVAKKGADKIGRIDLHWREGCETYPITDYALKPAGSWANRRYILDGAYYDTKYNLEWDLIITVTFVNSYFPRKELDSFFQQEYPDFFLVWSNRVTFKLYRIIARYID